MHTRLFVTAMTLTVGLALFGCKKGDDADASAASKTAAPAIDTKAMLAEFEKTALPEVQKLVPKDGPAVSFEAKLADKLRLVAATPKGWETGVIPGRFSAPEGGPFGFGTTYSAGSNCNGSCVPKDWKAVTEKSDFAQFRTDTFKLVKEEDLTGPAGKLMVATVDDGTTYMTVARWKDGASRYYVCRASLAKQDAALLPAFEKACLVNVPLFLK